MTSKPERAPVRRMRKRHEAGHGEPDEVWRSAYREAARPVWETRMVERQAKVRGLYLAQAWVLSRSADLADQALGAKVEAFVKGMPQSDRQRLALARELRAANISLQQNRTQGGEEQER